MWQSREALRELVALENFEEMKATFLVQIVEVMTEFERKDMMGKFFDIIE